LLISPGERWDVIVDFRALRPGTVVRLINTGPDTPFKGFDDLEYEPADPNTTGQVMEFHVVQDDPKVGESATSPYFLKMRLPDAKDPANLVDTDDGDEHKLVATTREFALLETNSTDICTHPDGLLCDDCVPGNGECVVRPTSDFNCSNCTPFGPVAALLGIRGDTPNPPPVLWSDPVSANPASHTTEVWEFWNWSPDAHSIHVHLVKFRVLGRFSFRVADGNIVRGEAVDESPIEAGWKDTVLVLPNQVTRIAATFDIDGLYVWHCHMLEHEDNEMMLPFCVGDGQKAPGCDAVVVP